MIENALLLPPQTACHYRQLINHATDDSVLLVYLADLRDDRTLGLEEKEELRTLIAHRVNQLHPPAPFTHKPRY